MVHPESSSNVMVLRTTSISSITKVAESRSYLSGFLGESFLKYSRKKQRLLDL